MAKLSTVIIKRREGSVPADTADYGWELYIDGRYRGMFKTKLETEQQAQILIHGEVL